MTMEYTRPRASSPWITILRMLGGAVVGGVAVVLYFSYARELRWADIVALTLALVGVIGAVRLYLDSFNADTLAKMLSVEGQPTGAEVAHARLQAAMMAVLGLSLIWPPVAALVGFPAPLWSYGIIAAALVANVWFTYRSFEQGDEFTRQRLLVMTWRASLVGQTLLIAYAGAERLGLAPTLTAWEVFIAFTAISLIAPFLPVSRKI